jgi:hypothetical protein
MGTMATKDRRRDGKLFGIHNDEMCLGKLETLGMGKKAWIS